MPEALPGLLQGGTMNKVMLPNVTSDIAALILRIAGGAIFLPHGWSKVAGEGGPAAFAADMAANYHIPAFLGYVAAYAEFAGAILLIAGLLTRLDALLLTGTMFVAAFIVQLPDALYEVPPGAIKSFVVLKGIELPLAMFAICAAILLIGPGRVSLDHLFGIERRFSGLLPKKKTAAEAAALSS
jgi:putative oxidoreductase